MFPFLLFGCATDASYYTLSGQKHTYHRIIYKHSACLDEGIMRVYDEFYRAINPFDPQSTISRVNRNEAVQLDPLFIEAFNRAMELAKQTDGAFDPTCAPLINRWGFGYEERPEAAQAESLECLKTYVGYDKIELSHDVIVKQDPRVQLNFSAIGDGFACEVIARYLEGQGVRDYLVDIGGEMIASGKNPSGNDWSVGIVQPPKQLGGSPADTFSAILHLSGKAALATSGNYNNFRRVNGKLRGHTIDPWTGYPVETNVLSVTVIAPDCVTADAYATALLVSTEDRLDRLLRAAIDYYIIYLDAADNYRIRQSEGMKRYIH
ncbi:MAG TPA: FAD:protein FMN transferase [Bacteroides reticulotermitis]|nr:FAD:protein FMN transferase [Bacteroides reticulotermitis]